MAFPTLETLLCISLWSVESVCVTSFTFLPQDATMCACSGLSWVSGGAEINMIDILTKLTDKHVYISNKYKTSDEDDDK